MKWEEVKNQRRPKCFYTWLNKKRQLWKSNWNIWGQMKIRVILIRSVCIQFSWHWLLFLVMCVFSPAKEDIFHMRVLTHVFMYYSVYFSCTYCFISALTQNNNYAKVAYLGVAHSCQISLAITPPGRKTHATAWVMGSPFLEIKVK